MFDVLASVLAFIYEHTGQNIGVAIILFTLGIMLALFPFTAKSTRSMAAMQRLQPEVKRLQAKHKNDRQALNEEMMGLYKEHGVNPLGGCLPMLLQFPVFIVLYRILYGLTSKGSDGTFDPKYLSESSALYRDLDGMDKLIWEPFGFDLARSANDALKVGFTAALPFVVLVALSIATGVVQQRQMTRRQPQQSLEDNPQAAAMQKMGKIFPIMFGVISWSFPAGLVLYFVTSNVFRILQQAAIYRFDPTLGPPGGGAAHVVEVKGKAADKSKPAAKAGGGKSGGGGTGAGPAGKGPKAGANGKPSTGNGKHSQANGKGGGGKAGPNGRPAVVARQQPKKSRKGR